LILEILKSSHSNDPNLESSQFLFVIDGYAINEVIFCSHNFWKKKQKLE